ncbi:MAG: hypothetical protein OXE02_12410 [Chloroflexi bacterium]|nr:hypothetical protein [Chloroflexota bacterium]
MAASTTTRPATKTGGLALIVGVILLVLASVLFPGGPVLDRVDQTDFPAALDAMAGNPSLAHLASMLSIVGMFLYAYTALTWLRLPQHGGLGASALRLGVFASLFGWSLYVIAMGMRHFSVHLLQRGMQSGADQAFFEGLALSVYAPMGGIIVALVSVYPIASILVGFGLASRFESMSIYRLASYGLVLMGVLAIINFLVLQHVPAIDPLVLLGIDNGLLSFGSLCFIFIGLGMYKGQGELTSED